MGELMARFPPPDMTVPTWRADAIDKAVLLLATACAAVDVVAERSPPESAPILGHASSAMVEAVELILWLKVNPA